MAIDFPNSPSVNDTHTSAGVTWKWDGTTWKAEGVTSSYTLPTASSTVLGGVKVGTNLSINASGVLSASGGEITVQEEGTSLSTAATTLNFVGSSVTATGTGATKTITISDSNDNTTYSQQLTVGSATPATVEWDLVPSVGVSDKITITAGNNINFTAATADAVTINATATGTPEITWTLGVSGSNYIFTGPGLFSGTDQSDPTLYLIRGHTYKFVNNTGGHPFRIQSTPSQTGGGTAYNLGVTNNDAGNGVTLTFDVPMDAPDTLYYQCTAHPTMTGTIYINDQGLPQRTTGEAIATGLADGAAQNITITAAKSYALLRIVTSHAAWVTLYTDTVSRTNDASRSMTTDPLPGTGVIAEVITSDGAAQNITPGIIGWNSHGPVTTDAHLKVVNLSGSTTDITITLHFVPLEN